MGFSALQRQTLAGGFPHDAPDGAGEVATAGAPVIGHAFEFIQVPRLRPLDAEGGRAGDGAAQIGLRIIRALVGFHQLGVDDPLPGQHLQEGGEGFDQLDAHGGGIDRGDGMIVNQAGDHPAIALGEAQQAGERVAHRGGIDRGAIGELGRRVQLEDILHAIGRDSPRGCQMRQDANRVAFDAHERVIDVTQQHGRGIAARHVRVEARDILVGGDDQDFAGLRLRRAGQGCRQHGAAGGGHGRGEQVSPVECVGHLIQSPEAVCCRLWPGPDGCESPPGPNLSF